jgi:hypothetical protein
MKEMTDSRSKGFGDFLLSVPWPWHLALAVACYFLLHALAGRDIPLPGQSPEEIALYTHRLVWKKAAGMFQYILPPAFALATLLSFRRATKKRRTL